MIIKYHNIWLMHSVWVNARNNFPPLPTLNSVTIEKPQKLQNTPTDSSVSDTVKNQK